MTIDVSEPLKLIKILVSQYRVVSKKNKAVKQEFIYAIRLLWKGNLQNLKKYYLKNNKAHNCMLCYFFC